MGKTKQVWEIKCGMCQTTVCVDAEIIISTDNCAEFLPITEYECGKCHSVCLKKLKEIEDNDT